MASIEKRPGPDSKPRYVVRYRDPSGKQRNKTFTRKVDAERHLVDVEGAKDRGTYVDPGRAKLTVGEWADQWLASKLDLAPKTRERYAGIISAHIRPRWGTAQLSKITHAELQRWIASIDVAPASVKKIHRVMSMLLAYAVKDGRLATNPAQGLSLPRVRHAERRFLTHHHVAQLAEAVGRPHDLVVLFLAYTGLRWGEMAALRVRRIDFLRRRVTVAESVTPTGRGLVWGDTKGHERRDVPLPRFLVDELSQYVSGKNPDDLVFTGLRGNPLRSQIFQRTVLNQACEQAGIVRVTPHELRHTAASLAIASGANVKVVQQMLGHKSATLTLDLYGHLFGDQLDVVADAMDAAREVALWDVSALCHESEVVSLDAARNSG
jgi:integrase